MIVRILVDRRVELLKALITVRNWINLSICSSKYAKVSATYTNST